MVATVNKPARKPTAKERAFAAYVVGGQSQADAVKKAYGHPEWSNQRAAEQGSRVAARPEVQAVINELRARSEAGVLLTVNDRLHILADIARGKGSKPNEKTRALDVYTKIAGGAAPLQVELTGAAGGAIQVAASVTVTHRPVKERIAALRAARESRT